MTYFLFFDIETTGLLRAKKNEVDYRKPEQFPNIVQVSWQLQKYKQDGSFLEISSHDYIIRPNGYTISDESSKIHGITHSYALEKGISIEEALKHFITDLLAKKDTIMVCHNIEFDVTILFYHIYKTYKVHFSSFRDKQIPCICTMLDSVNLCKLPSVSKFTNPKDPYKYPKLSELFYTLFGDTPKGQLHNSKYDVDVTITCFRELLKRELLTVRNASLVFA
jgi:DNA polymerase III epsilon subunit-like protein